MRLSIASFAFAWLVASVVASPVVDISAATEEASPLEKRECSKAGMYFFAVTVISISRDM